MNQFQKNVVFITGAGIVAVAVSIGLYFGITSHIAAQAKKDADLHLAWHNENIRQLKALSVVGVFSPEEQKRLDAAGDDPERLQQALLDIHQGRTTIWQSSLDDVEERARKLQVLTGFIPYGYGGELQDAALSIRKDETEARTQLAAFTDGYSRIEQWRPIRFEQYQQQANGHAQTLPGDARTTAIQNNEFQTTTNATPIETITPALNQIQPQPNAAAGGSEQESSNTNAITLAVNRYASAMLANDPDSEARAYAPLVEKYYLQQNVDNQFVKQDKQTFLDRGNRITKLQLEDVTIEDETASTASVRYTRDVSWVNGSASNHREIRSLLHLQKIDAIWKITYEQDFH